MKNIKSQYNTYSNIIDIIGVDRIEERLCAIHDVYNLFLEETGFCDGVEIKLIDRVLMHAILDYFTDITRLKEFHGIERINQDKIISYECSWFLKRKPIQVLIDNREDLVYSNEKFVLEIFVNHLVSNKINSLNNIGLLNNLCDTLLYYFKYRNCEPKILEMFIMCFKAGNSVDKNLYKK